MTDHAEVIRVRYDSSRISFGQILKVFFAVAHDPTHVNRQGNDIGRQYRSAIFYADDEQRRVADAYIKQLTAAKVFPTPIATTLEPLEQFFEGEDYHQDFVARNPESAVRGGGGAPEGEETREGVQGQAEGVAVATGRVRSG